MAVRTKVGSFTLSTDAVSTTQTITGVGFQPKLVFTWGSGRITTVDAAGAESIRRFFGVSIGTAQMALATRAEHNAATTATSRGQDEADSVIVHSDVAGVNSPVSDHRISSFNSDGFVVTVTQANVTRASRVHYYAIGGDEITNLKIGSFALTAGVAGAQAVTGVGFQPEFVMLFGVNLDGTLTAAGAPSDSLTIGMASSASQQGVVSNHSRNAELAGSGLAYHNDAEVFAHINNIVAGAATVQSRATIQSLDSDGFTINKIEAPVDSSAIHYLAIRGGNHRVGSLTTRTDTTPIVTSSLGVQVPKGVMFLSAVRAESALDAATANATISIGAATSATERRASGTKDVFGADPTFTATAEEHDEVYVNLSNTGTIDGLMDFSGFGTDSFTTVMDDPDPVAGMVLYWAIGEDTAPTGPTISNAGSWIDGIEFNVVGINFGENIGSAGLFIGGVEQTQIVSWTATQITGIASQGNHPFDTDRAVVVQNSDGITSPAVNIKWQVPVNQTFVTIADVSQPPEWRFTPEPDLEVGDQIHARNFSGIASSDFQLLTSGTWIANSVFLTSFEARVWDSFNEGWSEWALQTVLLTTTPPVDPPPGPGVIRTKAINCLVVE